MFFFARRGFKRRSAARRLTDDMQTGAPDDKEAPAGWSIGF